MVVSESRGMVRRLTAYCRHLVICMWLGRFRNTRDVICHSHIGAGFSCLYLSGQIFWAAKGSIVITTAQLIDTLIIGRTECYVKTSATYNPTFPVTITIGILNWSRVNICLPTHTVGSIHIAEVSTSRERASRIPFGLVTMWDMFWQIPMFRKRRFTGSWRKVEVNICYIVVATFLRTMLIAMAILATGPGMWWP